MTTASAGQVGHLNLLSIMTSSRLLLHDDDSKTLMGKHGTHSFYKNAFVLPNTFTGQQLSQELILVLYTLHCLNHCNKPVKTIPTKNAHKTYVNGLAGSLCHFFTLNQHLIFHFGVLAKHTINEFNGQLFLKYIMLFWSFIRMKSVFSLAKPFHAMIYSSISPLSKVISKAPSRTEQCTRRILWAKVPWQIVTPSRQCECVPYQSLSCGALLKGQHRVLVLLKVSSRQDLC